MEWWSNGVMDEKCCKDEKCEWLGAECIARSVEIWNDKMTTNYERSTKHHHWRAKRN